MTEETENWPEKGTEAREVSRLATLAAEPYEASAGEVLLLTSARTKFDFEYLLDQPRRKRGTVQLHDAASLCAFVNEHKTGSTRLYADAEAFTFVAVINDATAEGRSGRSSSRPEAAPDRGMEAVGRQGQHPYEPGGVRRAH